MDAAAGANRGCVVCLVCMYEGAARGGFDV